MVRYLAIISCALLFGSCVAPAKKFKAPSDVKVKATQKVLTEKQVQARATAKKAREATLKAQRSARDLIALANNVKDKLGILLGKVPPELIPMVTDIQTAHEAETKQEEQVRTDVADAVAWNTRLEEHQKEEEKARVDTISAADEYAGAAAGLAQEATDADARRYKAESQLLKEKVYRILWKIGGGLFVTILIVVIALWLFGKLGLVGAKIAAKF